MNQRETRGLAREEQERIQEKNIKLLGREDKKDQEGNQGMEPGNTEWPGKGSKKESWNTLWRFLTIKFMYIEGIRPRGPRKEP